MGVVGFLLLGVMAGLAVEAVHDAVSSADG